MFTPLELTTLTEDIRTWTDGSAYGELYQAGGKELGGVPFIFPTFAPGAAGNTIFYGGTLNDPVEDSLVIPVAVAGVTKVYALINTAFGAPNSVAGEMAFRAGETTYSVDLVVGANVRDHYFGSFVNTTTDPTTTQDVYGISGQGNAHYDMLMFALPDGFHLDTIIFTSSAVDNNPANGKAFLAAVTVASGEAVPDGGAMLVLAGLGVLGLGLLRARRA